MEREIDTRCYECALFGIDCNGAEPGEYPRLECFVPIRQEDEEDGEDED